MLAPLVPEVDSFGRPLRSESEGVPITAPLPMDLEIQESSGAPRGRAIWWRKAAALTIVLSVVAAAVAIPISVAIRSGRTTKGLADAFSSAPQRNGLTFDLTVEPTVLTAGVTTQITLGGADVRGSYAFVPEGTGCSGAASRSTFPNGGRPTATGLLPVKLWTYGDALLGADSVYKLCVAPESNSSSSDADYILVGSVELTVYPPQPVERHPSPPYPPIVVRFQVGLLTIVHHLQSFLKLRLGTVDRAVCCQVVAALRET